MFSCRFLQHVDAIVYLAGPLLMAVLVVSSTSVAAASNQAQMSSHTRGRLIALVALAPSLYLFSYPCPSTLDFAASLAQEAKCASLVLKSELHHLTCLGDLMQTETLKMRSRFPLPLLFLRSCHETCPSQPEHELGLIRCGMAACTEQGQGAQPTLS